VSARPSAAATRYTPLTLSLAAAAVIAAAMFKIPGVTGPAGAGVFGADALARRAVCRVPSADGGTIRVVTAGEAGAIDASAATEPPRGR
jgi:hypothetical protein